MPRKPMDYSKSVVYKICCKDNNISDCYVGSTTCLRNRKNRHKTSCNNEKDKDYNYPVYKFIRDNGGFDNWEVIMVEEYPQCKSVEELLKYEREHMEMLGATLNKVVIGRTHKEWREDNKEKCNAISKKYHEKNKEELNSKAREKVKCEFCGSMCSKRNIVRHQKSQKCLKAQGK